MGRRHSSTHRLKASATQTIGEQTMSTEVHILAVTIAHARLTLAHQRVREQALHAAGELQAVIAVAISRAQLS